MNALERSIFRSRMQNYAREQRSYRVTHFHWQQTLATIRALPNFNVAHVDAWEFGTTRGGFWRLWLDNPGDMAMIILNEDRTDLKYIVYVDARIHGAIQNPRLHFQGLAYLRYRPDKGSWAGPFDARLFPLA